MDIRLGTALTGEAVTVTIAPATTLLIVGDQDRGKTTLARYMARWWVAATPRHLHLVALNPEEWADLPSPPPQCSPGHCLVVIDDADQIDASVLAPLALEDAAVIVTAASTPDLPRVLGERTTSLGLLRGDATAPTDIALTLGDSRLDWPANTVVFVADDRGPIDFPCHRWEVAPEDAAVAR